MARTEVRKTYKLYVGGAFPRSESGRTRPVTDAGGSFMANAALASRKDLRDAVVAARKGHRTWAGATPYNRGQVLYRIAEMVESRRTEFVQVVRRTHGLTARQAGSEVDLVVDRLVHYAGWTDKLASVLGHANAVSGPYFCYSTPEPTGVVGVLAPGSLLGLVSCVAPVVAGGNSCVVVTPEACGSITFAEALATSDVPGGVINILTGDAAELGPWLASHRDVNALDLTGADAELRTELATAAAPTVKRVHVPRREPDFHGPAGTARLRAFLEIKTVWHPVGAPSLSGGGGY